MHFSHFPLLWMLQSASVTNFKPNAFQYDYAIDNIYLSENNQYFARDRYGAIYSKDMTILYKVPPQNTEYVIPRTVTTLLDESMHGLQKIYSISIPNTVSVILPRLIMYSRVTSITFESGIILENFTCMAYANIKSIVIPKSVKYFRDGCFWRASQMTSITFEEGSQLELIEGNAFAYCVFTSIIIPSKCKEIKQNAFNSQTKLKNISLPASIEKLYPETFANCQEITTMTLDPDNQNYTLASNSLLQSIDGSQTIYIVSTITSLTITAKMSSIGLSVLQGCDKLTTLTVETGNKYFYAEGGILYNIGKTKAIAAVGGLVTANVLATVTEIGIYCFAGCIKLTTINLGPNVVTLNYNSFMNANRFTKIIIPAKCKTINSNCFFGCTALTNITFLGDLVEYIGYLAFASTKLTSIVFSSKLKTLDHEAFSNIGLTSAEFHPDYPLQRIRYLAFYQTKLVTVRIPRNVRWIEYNAFYNIKTLTTLEFAVNSSLIELQYTVFLNANITTLTLPKSLKTMGQGCFMGCKNIEVLIFEEGMNISSFGISSFRECLNLVRVQLPSSIDNLSPTTFIGCTKLQSIDIPSDNEYYQSQQGIVYSKSGEKLIICPAGLSVATIKKTIIVIGSNAFYGCSLLETIIFEPGCRLEVMEEGTFGGCTALVRVDLPTSLQVVQRGSFEGCVNLQVITFPDNCAVNLDADSIFAGCISLTTVAFGKFCALTIIGEHEFSCCYNLSSIIIPANCTTIGAYAFENCTSLSSITYELNSQIASFGEGAFAGCLSLNDYYVPDIFVNITSECFGSAPNISRVFIEENLRIHKIGSNAFSTFPLRELIIGAGTTVEIIESSAFEGRSLASFHLNNLVKIEDSAFKNCASLSDFSVTDISSIGNNAFEGCISLTTFTVPTHCILFGNNAMSGCTSLTTISFSSSSLGSLGNYALSSCSSLKTISIPNSVTSIGNNCFQNCLALSSVTFSSSPKLSNIGSAAFSGCSSISAFSFPDTVKTIGNNCFQNCIKLSSITFSSSATLTSIGNYAFSGCTSISSLSLPQTLTTIGTNSFQNDNFLKKVDFGLSPRLVTIGNNAFNGCKNLTSIKIPKTTTTIGTSSFQNCILLSEILISSASSLTTIGVSAFQGCTSIKSLRFYTDSSSRTLRSSSPISLGNYAFKGCTNLNLIEKISISSIGISCFSSCESLSSFEVTSACRTISNNAFENCLNLRDLKFESHSTLTSIGANAFIGCISLNNFTVPDSMTTISSAVFGNAPNITRVVIPPNMAVTSINTNSFTNIDIHDFTVSDSSRILSIGDSVFAFKKLTKFVLHCDVRLGKYVFKNCTNLESIDIDSIYSFGSSCFLNCEKLKSFALNISSSQDVIPESSFEGCSSLSHIKIIGAIKTVSDKSFKGCVLLEFPRIDTITHVGNESFYKCISVYIPRKLQVIGNSAFTFCRLIDSSEKRMKGIYDSLKLPSSVSSIGSSAFNGTGIKIVYYCGDHDLSSMPKAFPDFTNVHVTNSYAPSIFCGIKVFGSKYSERETIFSTGIADAQAFRKKTINTLGCNLAMHAIINI